MKKEMILRQSLLAGVIAISLVGCTATSDEYVFADENDELLVQTWDEECSADGTQAVGEDIFEVSETVVDGTDSCDKISENCFESDDYLTTQFVQETDGDVVSLSRPAGTKAVAVKDKADNKKFGQTQHTETKEKVLYTTVSVPEIVDGEETLVSENTKETIITTIQKSEEKTETVTETEPKEIEVAVSEQVQMIPLKKVKTTITETTKVEGENLPRKEWSKDMTLSERIVYGQEKQEWEAKNGSTLRQLLLDWGDKAGWTVVWKMDRDYNLEAGVLFSGTFTEVSSALIRSFARATPAPIGTFYQGNRVLVINTQEDENER